MAVISFKHDNHIEHIDAIARKKHRDVMFLDFTVPDDAETKFITYRYEEDLVRREVLEWLETHCISYMMCGDFATELEWNIYRGQIYVDIVPNMLNKEFHNYLNSSSFKLKGAYVKSYILPLDVAMQNAYHDEDGFWDKWTEELNQQ